MSDNPETITVTVTKVIPIADVDGKAIRVGSVLRNIKDGEEGVVSEILRVGSVPQVHGPCAVGDIVIKKRPGVSRVTNMYYEWRHIPRNEQSYEQRYASWLYAKYDHDDSRQISRDEGLAIDGIMSLLPADPVNWEMGPWPDRLEDALEYLVEHLNELTGNSKS